MHDDLRNSGSQMRLYDVRNRRLYINTKERMRFLAVARQARQPVQNFALTLLYTGCRLSEALALRPVDLDTHGRLVSIRTLKKRNRHEVREVPIPPDLARALAPAESNPDHGLMREQQLNGGGDGGEVRFNGGYGAASLWSDNGRVPDRITGYRWIKKLMGEAGIEGAQASPKGLRHGYGVHAICSGVQLNMLRKWMGHASLSTTAIYANAVGREELAIADRMWLDQTVDYDRA
jgi:integrase